MQGSLWAVMNLGFVIHGLLFITMLDTIITLVENNKTRLLIFKERDNSYVFKEKLCMSVIFEYVYIMYKKA